MAHKFCAYFSSQYGKPQRSTSAVHTVSTQEDSVLSKCPDTTGREKKAEVNILNTTINRDALKL